MFVNELVDKFLFKLVNSWICFLKLLLFVFFCLDLFKRHSNNLLTLSLKIQEVNVGLLELIKVLLYIVVVLAIFFQNVVPLLDLHFEKHALRIQVVKHNSYLSNFWIFEFKPKFLDLV